MTPHLNMRVRRVIAGLGALSFAYTMTADTPFAAQADTPGAVLAASVRNGQVAFGKPVVVQGVIPGAPAGEEVALQFRTAGGAWTTLKTTHTHRDGSYRVAAPVKRSGVVRIALNQAATRSTATPPSLTPSGAAASSASGTSAERPVAVGAYLDTAQRSTDVLAGRSALVAGTVRPWIAGRRVALQLQSRGRWTTVARTATGARGRYRLTYTPRSTGSVQLRVRFGGDAVNAATTRSAGDLNSYRSVGASWYDVGGGSVACAGLGGVTMGVANKTLPCGTHLTLRYGGRSVGVTVIDRGPYVAGREFDLTAPVKQALGFGDTGQVWTTR
jgi:rare lipoprotein A